MVIFFQISTLGQQDNHTYGPVYENYYADWIKGSGDPYFWTNDHQVGIVSQGENYEVRNIDTWQWNYNDIPTIATITSVVITFKGHHYTPYEDFHFNFHNIPYPGEQSGINFFNEFTSDNIIYDKTLTHDANGYVYFSHTFLPNDGSGVCGALSSAVQSGQYFFTLGINEVGTALSPPWSITDNDGGGVDGQAISLTINYTTSYQDYKFVNNIEGTENYGMLTVKDNTKGVTNSISSGTPLGLSWNDDITARTNELPFDVNWKSTGKTEKHNHWIKNSSNNYSLYENFTADLNYVSSKLTSKFNSTAVATITTNLSSGVIEFKDPWYYYSDSGTWYQTDQFNSYNVPFDIDNGSTESYGGIFLNQAANPDNPYYAVRVLLTPTIGSSTAFFSGWSYSGATLQQVEPSPSGYDQKAVVFTSSSGATITANYSYDTISRNTTLSSGTYNIAGNLTVQSGVTLTLSSGAVLNFPSGAGLTVNGTLVSNGATLTSSDNSSWNGITLNNAYGSSIQNTTISYAISPIVINSTSNVTISGCTINNSSFYDNNSSSAAAIQVWGSSPTISSTTIEGQSNSWNGVRFGSGSTGSLSNCTIENLGYGNGVIVQGASSPDISGCTISSNHYYGIIVNSNSSGTPTIENNQLSSNGSGQYHNIVFLSASGGLVTGNSISGSYAGVGAYGESFPSSGGSNQGGYNTITDNSYGLMAGNSGTVIHFGSYAGNNLYQGTCNEIYNNTVYDAYASGGSITAEYNWWGQASPSTTQFYEGSGSTVDYSNALSSPAACPLSGALALASAQTPTSATSTTGSDQLSASSLLGDATQAMFNGDFSKSALLCRNILKSSTNNNIKNIAVIRLGQLFLSKASKTEGDTTIPTLLNSYANIKGETGRHAEYMLANIYLAKGHLAKAEAAAQDLIAKYPGTETERQGLILLASLFTYDRSFAQTSEKALSDLKSRFSASIDSGLVAALTIPNSVSSNGKEVSKGNINRSDNAKSTESPKSFSVANYPNPFNPTTTISYQLPKKGMVSLKVYDLLGREIAVLADGIKSAGYYEVNFSGINLSSGVYIYRLTDKPLDGSKEFTAVKKLMLLK